MLSFLLPSLKAISYFQQRTPKETVVTYKFEIKDGIQGEYCSANDDKTLVTCSQTFTNETMGYYFKVFEYRVDSPIKSFKLYCEGTGGSYCRFKFANTWQFNSEYYNVPIGTSKTIDIDADVKQDYEIIPYFVCDSTSSQFAAPYVEITKYDGTLKDYQVGTITEVKPGVQRATLEINPGDAIAISTIPVLNAYPILANTQDHNIPIPGSNVREMIVPFIANSTHVVGIDVYQNEYILYWTYANSVADDGTPFQYMFISMRPLQKFNLSYLIIKKDVHSYHDAAEKWHTSLNDIYDKPDSVPGAAFSADDIDPSEWVGKEKVMAENYMGRILSKDKFEGTKDSRFLYYQKTALGTYPSSSTGDFEYDGYNIYATEAHNIVIDTTSAEAFTKYLLVDPVNGEESYSQVMKLFNFIKTIRERFPGKGIMVTMPNIPPQLVNMIDYHLDRLDLGIPRLEPKPNQYYFMNAQKTRLFGNRYALGSKKFGILDVDHRVEDEIFASCLVLGCVPSFAVPPDDYEMYDDLFVSAKYGQVYKKLFNNKTFLANGYQHQFDTPSTYYSSWCNRDGSGVCYGAYLIGYKDVTFHTKVNNLTECYFTPAGAKCEVLENNVIKLSSISPYRTIIVKYKTSYMKPEEVKQPIVVPVPPGDGSPNGAQVGSNSGFRLITDNRWVLIVIAAVLVMLILAVVLAIIIWLISPKKEESDQEDIEAPPSADAENEWPEVDDSGETVSVESGDIQGDDGIWLGDKNPEQQLQTREQLFSTTIDPKPEDFALDGSFDEN